ncbi:MAG: alpha/beta hydrolase family protein, partial [Solirubrobacteraceae bacterium]
MRTRAVVITRVALLLAFAITAADGIASIAASKPAARRSHTAVEAASRREPRFAVGEIVLRFTDRGRRVSYPGHGRPPRTLVTVIRYPAAGPASRVDVPGAPPARTNAPFPLIVFAHGFNITPEPYRRLLESWARAGYVVAAPIFPLTNANAPGGPNESDLINQPRDMSFVISRMLAASAGSGVLSGLVNQRQVAVAGQSDGGSTALATAYNRNFFDRRVRGAMILSGARIPGVDGYDFPAPAPPLLAAQGTADTTNAPASTYHYFRLAPHPKFLLSLLGA